MPVMPKAPAWSKSARRKVLCTASVEDKVPPFLKGKGQGWLTAEYSMLPASHPHPLVSATPASRAGAPSKSSGLVGRSLRSIVEMESLGERTITLDCDVLQADGGTRTAAISGAFVALVEAL